MKVDIIAVPFDSGLRDARMGRGPAHLLQLGIVQQMQALGADVSVRIVEPSSAVFPTEIRMALELQRAVAAAVAGSLHTGAFPLVLSGNCNIAVGVIAGLHASSGVLPAVCWFDAHADFNTPESTVGGFLDGMAVSMLAGNCWRQLTAQVPGYQPIPTSQMLLIGTRDIDPLERDLLAKSSIRIAAAGAELSVDLAAVTAAARTTEMYLHLDLDALDPSEGRANGYAVSGGLSRSELFSALDAIESRATVCAASITAYDPECDIDDRIGGVAIEVAKRLAVRARS